MSAQAVSPQEGGISDLLRERVGTLIQSERAGIDMHTVECESQHLLELCTWLRDELAFTQLSDLCGVDYSTYGHTDWRTTETTHTGFSRGVAATEEATPPKEERAPYVVVYHLLSFKHNTRLRVRCPAQGDPPRIESVVTVWSSAQWYEREAFDLYGILFEGHPDLRRLLTDYGFMGHPFRKDFPLEGKQEVRYDPEQGRVIYQPVTIRNRVLVPRVIRKDNRYLSAEDAQEAQAPAADNDA